MLGLLRCWVSGMACVVVPVGMLPRVTDRVWLVVWVVFVLFENCIVDASI